MSRSCSISGCSRVHIAGGLCGKHYERKRRGLPILTDKEVFVLENPPKDGVGLIPLTQGKIAIVDEEDYKRVLGKQWCLKSSPFHILEYAHSYGITMHRFIMGSPKDLIVDHKDHNGLNNRKENLRLTNFLGNSRNTRKLLARSSRFKGVSWGAKERKWKAQIRINGKQCHLAFCENESDAATYYDIAAQLIFGSFAHTNAKED